MKTDEARKAEVVRTELLPCPFCGRRASVVKDSGNEVWGQSWLAGCTKCGIQFKVCGSNSWDSSKGSKAIDKAAEAKAIALWNTRVTPPAPQAQESQS